MNEIETTPKGNIPYFSRTDRDGYQVPQKQAVFTGVLFAAAAVAIALLAIFALSRYAGIAIEPLDVLFVASAACCATFFPVAIFSWFRAIKAWMHIIEEAMLADANKNGVPDWLEQPPVRQPAPMEVTVKSENGLHADIARLPYVEQWKPLAPWLAKGNPNKFTVAAGKTYKLTQAQVWEIQKELVARGLAVKDNPNASNSSITLTAAGRNMMRKLADRPTVYDEDRREEAPLPSSGSAQGI